MRRSRARAWWRRGGGRWCSPGPRRSSPICRTKIWASASLAPRDEAGAVGADDANRLLELHLHNGVAHLYGAAMWDQEDTERLVVNDPKPAGRMHDGTLALPATPPTRDSFVAYLKGMSARLEAPVKVEVLSTAAAPESAPADTLHAGGDEAQLRRSDRADASRPPHARRRSSSRW